MSFRFRFPIAVLDTHDKVSPDVAVEQARDWAKPLDNEKRKRPTLEDAEAWVQEIVTERDRQRAEKNEAR